MTALLDRIIERLGDIILGKEHQLRLALTCLLARGHLLIEDLPGVGKTTLAHSLAAVLGLHYQRIQFTSDLLPADILGVSIYNRDTVEFQFHPGPVFSHIVLADEINRATPKTQSALLEAMEENQITIEGETRALPQPFFVIATQNPLYQIGTFPLPESQLDRFLMRIELGYPDTDAERQLLRGDDRRTLLAGVEPLISTSQLLELQRQVDSVHAADALLDYLQALLEFSRQSPRFENGLSPRAGLALLHSAKAWALLAGRDLVLPEDLQTVLPAVVGHRLLAAEDQTESLTGSEQLRLLLESVPLP
ncbi:MAG: MoxR family ATPase [Gammaproteobacteria bacterium]|nr:MoxR family ATPase [Gammaproteobacteria bacterium]